MNYNRTGEMTGVVQSAHFTFNIDGNESNFSAMGFDASDEMISYESERAKLHRDMILDFEDNSNLDRFIELLDLNPSTAFNIYHSEKGRI